MVILFAVYNSLHIAICFKEQVDLGLSWSLLAQDALPIWCWMVALVFGAAFVPGRKTALVLCGLTSALCTAFTAEFVATAVLDSGLSWDFYSVAVSSNPMTFG